LPRELENKYLSVVANRLACGAGTNRSPHADILKRSMSQSIETITDKGQFADLFNKYFSVKEIFVRTKSGDLVIQFLGYSEGHVAFRIPRVKNVPDMVIIFARHQANTIYASLKFLENNEDTFIFLPVKFQIISEKRKENRTSLDESGGKKILYITNVLSSAMIESTLNFKDKNVDLIKGKVMGDLKRSFEKVKIIFISDTKIDTRMKRLQETRIPIYVQDINQKPGEAALRDYYYYLNEIYTKDYKLSSQKDFISEITVPVIFRNMIPYGYIQVNGTVPYTDNHFTAVKRVAMLMNELFKKENLFQPAPERFIVSDVSKNGLGIVFKDRRLTRFFMKESTISLDLLLPNGKKVILGSLVRNTIFQEGGVIKVGCQIIYIDPISEVEYDEFLESIHRGED
jgi:hypothetical protein